MTCSYAVSLLVVCMLACGPSASVASAATLAVCPAGCTYATIQAAINAAAPGDTVAVGPGTYVENVVIDRPLTLRGAGTGREEDDDMARPVIVPAMSAPNPCTNSSLCGGAASNVILVQADDVTITGLVLDGDNPALTSGITRGGADVDARNGIITNHRVGVFNNLKVARVTVRNVYLRGIYASSGGTFDFHDNRVSNVQGDGNSIAMFNFGGSGTMSRNRVSDAADAISSNWSTGVRFIDNKIARSASGVHTDNAGWSGSTPDMIRGNRVKDCQTDGYGVWVFAPYLAPTVQDNAVDGCAVGLAAFGQSVPVAVPFIANVVDGAGAPTSDPANSVGVIVSTDLLGWGSADVSASFSGNVIRHFNTGVYVEQGCELYRSFFPDDCASSTHAIAVLHGNTIHGNRTGADGLAGTSVNAENNWWGCRKGPNHPGCDTVRGTVDFTPWLTTPPRRED